MANVKRTDCLTTLSHVTLQSGWSRFVERIPTCFMGSPDHPKSKFLTVSVENVKKKNNKPQTVCLSEHLY